MEHIIMKILQKKGDITIEILKGFNGNYFSIRHTNPLDWDWYDDDIDIEDIKPYLFPLSSITEEQKNELREMEWSFDNSTICNIIECFGTYRAYVDHSCCSELIDWFIKNHFDYRGLIPMELANDATGLNIY